MISDPSPDLVRRLVAQLTGPSAADAWFSLVERGASALPDLARSFDETSDVATRAAIMTVVAQQRSRAAVALLERGLRSDAPTIWKAALDGVVAIGGAEAEQTVARALTNVSADKRAWLEEAAGQIKEMRSDTVKWLQGWYASHCNGDWEHEFGVRIETLDNPGWSVAIDLADTPYQALQVFHEEHRSETDWIVYRVKDEKLEGACGPANLTELLDRLRSVLSGIDPPSEDMP